MNTKIAMMLVLGVTVSMLGTTMISTQPADAKVNCDTDSCSGGLSYKDLGANQPGGSGARLEFEDGESTRSGGSGGNLDNGLVGGDGGKTTCDISGCEKTTGGSGRHLK